MSDDRWTVPPPDAAVRARAAEIKQRWQQIDQATGGRWEGEESQHDEAALARAQAEVAYGCEMPVWVRVACPRGGPDLPVDEADPDDHWLVHVTHHADGTSKVHGCILAGLAKQIGTRRSWDHPCWTVPTPADPDDAERTRCQFPPETLLRFLPQSEAA